jgi:hypothetical protein
VNKFKEAQEMRERFEEWFKARYPQVAEAYLVKSVESGRYYSQTAQEMYECWDTAEALIDMTPEQTRQKIKQLQDRLAGLTE